MQKYEGYKFDIRQSLIGVQFLFVAFGALVLVPILTGLDTSVALFTAGLGTLAFQLITRKNVPPIFLASSFAFIAPISYGVGKWGIPATMGGIVFAGLLYVVLSFIIRVRGDKFLHKLLPPVVVGPVIMTIGLLLSPAAVNMAMGKIEGASYSGGDAMIVSGASLLVTMVVMMFGRGMLRLVPIFCGIFVGYVFAVALGMVDFTPVLEASWFKVPNFSAPVFELDPILYMIPIAIAPAIEHIGDMLAISHVSGENFLKKPGLKNTLLGDGVATIIAAFFAGPPNTTYSEVTGAVSITKAYNPAIMTFAAIASIMLAFVGKLGAILATIPAPVVGGIMLLLFGIIASVGLSTLLKHNVDMNDPRNMIIVALILVSAIGGMELNFGIFSLSGIGLGAVVGIVLNLILPRTKHYEGF
ncbi:uracil-xanthine permease family protein [Campylobacter sp. 19-13652]|uniref:uracil-xanthine permease family protein n=1 Tax=Campylobacter sp. 19-13652 TaxID=2840180 RepID=UPI001C771AF6|nr:uracil-xanthine permease family protein [Campylobacter sp. 19-13652]BCX79410.1 uracil permease [Campylobacter sp. 19-13652]